MILQHLNLIQSLHPACLQLQPFGLMLAGLNVHLASAQLFFVQHCLLTRATHLFCPQLANKLGPTHTAVNRLSGRHEVNLASSILAVLAKRF